MDEIEVNPRAQAPEAAYPHDAQNERRPGIIAKGQQPLRLVFGELACPVKLAHRAPTHRVAAQKTQEKSRGSGPAHPEKPPGKRLQPPPYPVGKAQRNEQSRHHKIGKQRRNHRPGAKGQSPPHRLRRHGTAPQQQHHDGYQNQSPQFSLCHGLAPFGITLCAGAAGLAWFRFVYPRTGKFSIPGA